MTAISQRMGLLAESETLRLNSLVQELKRKGETVFNLTAGEPDFAVPDAAKEAVFDAVRKNQSKYTPVPGIPELRERIAAKTNAQQPGISKPWAAGNVLVTNGGKQALFQIFQAIVNPGEEVVIPGPFWVSYPEMVKFAGGVPKVAATTAEDGYKLSPEGLERALSSKTRAVVFNSPSNPTGATYSRADFEAFGKVLRKFPNVWIVSDEIYDQIVYPPGKFCSFLAVCPDLQERTITVNGMSKSAAMTGWRVGWSVAPVGLTSAMNRLQGQLTSGVNGPAQWASVAALELSADYFKHNLDIFLKRRDLAFQILSKSAKLKGVRPEGAFYIFVRLQTQDADAARFGEALLQQAKVAVVPGAAFGDARCFRLSFATDERTLQEGCERLVTFTESFG